MRWMSFTVVVLLLAQPGMSVARPPEKIPGKMLLVPDEVADGLRRYRKDWHEGRRRQILETLAETDDPRVTVVLWELFEGYQSAAVAGRPVTSLEVTGCRILYDRYVKHSLLR
jgi:hypothetical protein